MPGLDQSGRSPRLVEALALLGIELTFAPVAERLAWRCGVRVGASRVAAVTEGAGRTQDLGGASRLPWRYVVHPGDVAAFGRHLWLEAHRQGVQHAERVIVFGDGAHGIRHLAEEHFPAAVHIVDLWHAAEHLWAAGRALLDDDEARVGAWVERATARLTTGAVLALVAEWATLPPKDAAACAAGCTSCRN